MLPSWRAIISIGKRTPPAAAGHVTARTARFTHRTVVPAGVQPGRRRPTLGILTLRHAHLSRSHLKKSMLSLLFSRHGTHSEALLALGGAGDKRKGRADIAALLFRAPALGAEAAELGELPCIAAHVEISV